LIRNSSAEIAACRSLSCINERLLKGWSDGDEVTLKEGNSEYLGALREISTLEGKTDSPALDEPFRALTQNASYRDARLAFARRITAAFA
jgi:hypothetical protein